MLIRGCKAAAVTVSKVLPDAAPDVAVIVTVPTETVVARPAPPTVATDGFDEVQVTDDISS